MDQIELQVKKKWSCVTKRRFTRWAAGIDIAPGLRPHHQRDRRGDDRLARRVDAVLRHAEGTSGLANAGRREAGVIAYKIAAHAADVARHRPGARDATTLFRTHGSVRLEQAVHLSLDPEPRERCTTKRCRMIFTRTRILLDVRPEILLDEHERSKRNRSTARTSPSANRIRRTTGED